MSAQFDKHQYNLDFVTLNLGVDMTDENPDLPLEGRGVVLTRDIKNVWGVIFPPGDQDSSKFYGMIFEKEERGRAGEATDAPTRTKGRPVSVLRRGHYPRAMASGNGQIFVGDRVVPNGEGFWKAITNQNAGRDLRDAPCRAFAITGVPQSAATVKGYRFAIDLR